jgi:hypothetical protein
LEDALISNGWNQSNIKKLYGLPDGEFISWDLINRSIIEIGENDTEYDTTLIVIASHGSECCFATSEYSETILYSTLNESLYNLSSTVGLIICACKSGGALENYSKLSIDNRVIMTSTNATEGDTSMYVTHSAFGFDLFADYCIGDDPDNPIGDGNGAVSMKEVYDYNRYNYADDNNSLFWSGYPIITQDQYYPLHITFQNFEEGKIDQITNYTHQKASNTNVCKDNTTGVDWRVAQEFQPSMEKISKVRIYLYPDSVVNSTIRLSIQDVSENGEPNGTDLVYADVLRSEIPDNDDYKTYISFNFPDDYTLDTEKSYFIVIRTIQSDPGKYYLRYYNHDYYSVTPGCNYSYWFYDNGNWTNYSENDLLFVTYGKNTNMPPYTPIRPFSGPKVGCTNLSYDFNVTTTDIDGDKVMYGFHWDGGDIEWHDNNSNYYNSGDIVKINHTWETPGQKFINVTAKDTNGNQGGWSDVWYINIFPNEPPNNVTIDGPTIVGKKNHDYILNSTDPDGNDVKYYINWSGGIPEKEWTDYNRSGEEVIVKHSWPINKRYTIRVKARDTWGAESDWTELKIRKNCNIFGYTYSGVNNQNLKDKISGTRFTMTANGIADNITAYLQTTSDMSTKTKCLIYENSELIGTTEEKILDHGEEGAWVTYNFSEPKPELSINTEYILVCWSNNTCNLSYDNLNTNPGRYKNQTYGASLESITWDDSELKNYSIYCEYTTKPEITNVSATPSIVGFGYNITIIADINGNGCGINNVTVNITYPNNTSKNFTMNNTGNTTYEYVFSDTWLVGEYDYNIWVVDNSWSSNYSTESSFNVSGQATISICTIKDSYGNNEMVNLTDPPCSSYAVGYELLDDGDVLHIWNNLDHYYFDTDSGIQLTNHYNEYWSHNVLMLGYYNNDEWNLIYRTDELSGFNKEIESDNETYVNATLWKNLNYEGYDFRLAIRYHLGYDDNELTVIPYIKNIDNEDIPYNLGFAWEIKDIQIDMTEENDYIEIDGETYYLNTSGLDETYTNLDIPSFYIKEDITDTKSESLYLRWDENLNYKVQVKSRYGQYNAPVTLGIKIGTLNAGQEKSTEIYWYDACKISYYYDSYDTMLAWATNPAYMVDGNTANYSSTTIDRDVEICNGNTCSGDDYGTISKVEIRAFGKYSGSGVPPVHDIVLKALGGNHYYSPGTTGAWSSWYDITNNPGAEETWTWDNVNNLTVEVESSIMGSYTMYCSKIEVQVTYNINPTVYDPYPTNGANGITITPVLNISVNDADGDTMDITWLSNSSGSWQVFGTNNSVTNGTYHQTFSNATVNGQWWYWKVNVSDGMDYVESNVFSFYTGYQSKIENLGSTNISGYLSFEVHYYNDTSEEWEIDLSYIEPEPRVIKSGEQLGLDTIFNGYLNTSDLSMGNGTYRIYVAFMDNEWNILKIDNGTELIATYEFEVTFE